MQNNIELDVAYKKLSYLHDKIIFNENILDKIEEDLVSLNLASIILTEISIKYLKDFTLFNIIANYSINFYHSYINKYQKIMEQYNEIHKKNEKYVHRFLKIMGQTEYIKTK